jgi:hypothetical protein
MRLGVVAGLLLAAATGVLILLSDPLRLNLAEFTLVGVSVGAVLGLMAERVVWDRVAGFAIGLVAAWVSYGARAGFLPDSSVGRAVALVGLLLFLVLVVWLAGGRLDLAPMLLGVAALAGAYELTFIEAPPRFFQESPVALTGVLLAAAIGFACTVLAATLIRPDRLPGRHRDRDGGDGGEETEAKVPFDEMFYRDQEVRP